MSDWKASDELDGIPLGTAAEERLRAKAWMDTAAQHCRNEFYWRERAKKAEASLAAMALPPSLSGATVPLSDDNTEFPDVPACVTYHGFSIPLGQVEIVSASPLGNLPAGVEELPAPPEVPRPIKWREWL